MGVQRHPIASSGEPDSGTRRYLRFEGHANVAYGLYMDIGLELDATYLSGAKSLHNRERDYHSLPQTLLFELKDARVTPHVAMFGGTLVQISNVGVCHVGDAQGLIR